MGILFLHSMGISHNDIKPPNIMYNKGRYKYIDFGSVKKYVERCTASIRI